MRTDLAGLTWRKSSRSNGTSNCVEIAQSSVRGIVAVRDSKDPSGPALVVDPAAFAAFTRTMR